MKKLSRLSLLFLILIAFSSTVNAEQPRQPWTLDECVTEAVGAGIQNFKFESIAMAASIRCKAQIVELLNEEKVFADDDSILAKATILAGECLRVSLYKTIRFMQGATDV